MTDRLQRLLLGLLAFTLTLVALACAPGLQDDLIARLPRGVLPAFLVWGLGDAVMLPKLLVTWVMAPLIVAVALATALGRGRPAGGRIALCAGACAFAGWAALSTALGIEPALGWESVVTVALIAACGAACGLALDGEGAMRALVLAALPAIPVALYSIAQHLGLDPLGWDPRHAEPDRSIATFGNPDFFATWMAAVVPIAAWRAGAAGGARARAGWGGVAGLLAVVVVFSYTRAAWLALLFEAVVMSTWCRPRWDRPARVAFLVTAVSLTLLLISRPTQSFTLAGRLGETMSGDRSTSVRLVLWREALAVVAASPWTGTGVDTFSYAAMPHRAGEPAWLLSRVGLPGDPHNAWLELAAASGLGAVVIALALVWLGARAALTASRGEGEQAHAARFTVVCGAALCLEQLLLRMTVPSWWLAFVLLAAAVALRWPVAGGRPPRAAVTCLLLLGLLGSVSAVALGARVVEADSKANLAGMVVEQALRVGGADGAHLLRDGLARYEEAQALAGDGARGGRIAARQARALETLLARVSPAEARDAQRPLVEAVGARAVALDMAALQSNRLDPYLWHDLARVLELMSARAVDPGRAAELANQSLSASQQGCALDPFNAALLADHARRLAVNGRYEAADEAFRRALELDPEAAPVRVDRARMLHRWGRDAEAIALLREVVRQDPGNAVAVGLLDDIQRAALPGAGGSPRTVEPPRRGAP